VCYTAARSEDENANNFLGFLVAAGVRSGALRTGTWSRFDRKALVSDSGQRRPHNYRLHHGDLPEGLEFGAVVAIDTEAMGLNPHRDRLCLVQLSAGDGNAHLVQFEAGAYGAPRLKALLADPAVLKLFHFARFDLAVLYQYLGVMAGPVYCTKIASRIARTFTDKHGLRDLCKDVLGVDLSKQQQSSDWGATALTDEQLRYAASDVLHLHVLRERLDSMLMREGRMDLARASFEFLPTRVRLDLAGWAEQDIFAH
jgi:ribonuclease D